MRRTAQIGCGALVALVALACSDKKPSPAASRDAPPPRRVIEHPRNPVYALPPHKIRSDGMGPYILGQALATVLYAVPSGAGVEVLDIPGVVRLSVVPVEEGRMVVGGDPIVTSFVSVHAPQVARTEAGIEVGSTRAALVAALGEPVTDPVHVTDPRVLAFASLPGVRFIVEGDTIAAAIVATPVPHPEVAGAGSGAGADRPITPACGLDRGGEPTAAVRAALGGAAARIDCLTATEAVAAVNEEIVVISAGDKPRRLFSLRVPGLVFAGAAHAGGRDEIIAVAVRATEEQMAWSVVTARWEAGRATKLLDEPAYTLTERSASWLGTKLSSLELLIDVEARTDMVVASGVLVSRAGPAIRLAVPLVPISVARRKRPVPEPASAGSGDASVQPLGDAAENPDAPPP